MIHLLVNYYKTKHVDRQKEIDFCFQHNVLNQFINTIHCFITQEDLDSMEIKSDKIKFNIIEDRPTYYDYFNYGNDNIA